MSIKPFPDVDPGQIEAAGKDYHSAASELATAQSSVRSVIGTASWRSPEARPGWDSALQARASDIGNAHEVMDHVGNVLRTTGSELARSKADYDAAQFAATFLFPDPRNATVTGGLPDLLDPNRPAPTIDPEELKLYLAQEAKANQAVDDAEYLLALCARELMSVSQGVTFESLPYDGGGGAPAVASDGYTIIPLSPAFGAPSGAVYANGIPVPLAKGRAFESQILRELGIQGSKQFFRPDAKGNFNLPRTKSGTLYRGTFPDSMRAGVLEIKSGTTEIKLSSPQIRVQLWVARTLGQEYNIVTDQDTQVDPALIRAAARTGGSVYSRVPGNDSVYYDRNTQEYVKLHGGGGAQGDEMVRIPITEEEANQIPAQVRSAVENQTRLIPRGLDPGGETAPSPSGPTEPYVTEQEYTTGWENADVSPDGDTPLPGLPEEEVPGGVEEPVTPVEPIEPIEPVEPIMPEEFFEEIIP